MEIPKEVLELLTKKVSYCRARPTESGETELFRGEGVITGIIIGATKRPQFLVQDLSESKDKAWTLDPICINPTEQEASSYFSHHNTIKGIVEHHNQSQKDRELEKIAEVDDINAKFFGSPLAL